MRDILLTAILAVLLSISVFFNVDILRPIAGFIIILFLPGYALSRLLFDNLDSLERIVISMALSIAVSIITGVLLSTTKYGLKLDSLLISLTAFTLFTLFLGSHRDLTNRKTKQEFLNKN